MTTRALTLAALAGITALSACVQLPIMPTTNQSAPQIQPIAAPKDRLVAAIEENGCVLTAGNVDAILLRSNLTTSDLRTLTPELAAEGRAEVAASGTIRVLTERCI